MRGLSCGSCEGRRPAKPYVTAYEIAVKHGFRGTEAEWIATLQSVYLTRVNSVTGETWKCSDTYAELIALAGIREVHLVTLDGRTAFPQGNKDGKLVFRTASYETLSGTVYEQYTLTEENTGTWTLLDVEEPDAGSITKTMLSTQVQNLLDGAVQKSAQAAKTDDQTQAVGIDADGKMWVTNITDYIPASVQPASTGMTCQIGLDANQQLWAEGYKVPVGGIPATTLAQTVRAMLNLAPVIGVVIKKTTSGGSTVYDVDWDNTDLHGYNSIPEAINDAADVRAIITDGNTFAEHPFCYAPDPNIIVFAGPEYDTFGEGTATIVYYIVDATQPHVTRVVKTLS